MKAGDIMTAGAATVRIDATVAHAARTMLEHRVSGLPVVDAAGKLAGIVTERDLLRRAEIGTEKHRPGWVELWLSPQASADEYVRARTRKVSDVMSTDVVTVGPETPLDEVISLMERKGFKRLPVVREGKIVGIISRANFLVALSHRIEENTAGPADDLAIRRSILGEIEAQLRGPLGMSSVRWLTSPELALACRTGFAPGDRAGIVEALSMREKDAGVAADVPWAMAGPSGADATVRHYSHDAWNSISSTIKLPTRGAVMGALAPILTPSEAGERRSFVVAYPIVSQSKADRQSGNAEWAADIAEGMNERLGRKTRAKQRDDASKARGLDMKLARGNALTRPYAVCTVTVPKTSRISEFGRRLDASIRRAGFAPLRLDLAQDVGFAASTVPLGISLTRAGDA